jgi:hypothetical protein
MHNSFFRLYKNAGFRDTIKGKIMQRLTSPETVGGLIGTAGSIASGAAFPLVAKKFPQVTPEKVDAIVKQLGLEGKVNIDMSDTAAPLWRMDKNNAFFNPANGGVKTLSTNMNTGPILGHELGHAHIHNNPGFVQWLQDNIYGPSRVVGPLAQTEVIKALTKNETSPMAGALKGGLASGVINAGTLIPEFEASRRGIQALNQVEGGTAMEKLKNYGGMAPGMASYLSSSVGSGAAQGYRQALQNKQKPGM